MEQHINQVIESQFPKRSAAEALESYKHIELDSEELDAAILWAKQRKEQKILDDARKEKEEENRKALTSFRWSPEQTNSFILYRAHQIFADKLFVLDEHNKFVYELLVHYFSESMQFISMANNAGIVNSSLSKGLLLAGNFGVGKTWLMKLFSKNQRQVFHVKNAKSIADDFEANGEDGMGEYVNKPKNAVNDTSVFFQPFAGLCIDDLGTEDIKMHYGNRKNVIGDLLEKRYAAGNTGIFLHATTNLTSDQLKEFYGERVISRMREIFNLIELIGNDRRI